MTMPQQRYLNAPFGYILTERIEWHDKKRLRQFAHKLVDSQFEDYHKTVDKESLDGLRRLLKDNGFTFDKEFYGERSYENLSSQ